MWRLQSVIGGCYCGHRYLSTYSAYKNWETFLTYCVDCPSNDQYCYGDWAYVVSAITTVTSTAWAFYQWASLAAYVLKRDGLENVDIFNYSNGPLSLDFSDSTQLLKRDGTSTFYNVTAMIDGTPKYLLNMTHSYGRVEVALKHHPDVLRKVEDLLKRDYTDQGHQIAFNSGIKYSYCVIHPEHHLTTRYDWDDIWAANNDNLNNYLPYFYNDIGDVDLNDIQPGSWKTLMTTGTLVIEQSSSFGHEFENCDRNAFDSLAR